MNETPQDGLSYNLVLGYSQNDKYVKSPMANMNNGYRLLADYGNVCQVNQWTSDIIPYYYSFAQVIPPDYWGVQTIDHGFAGSSFATDNLYLPETPYLQLYNKSVLGRPDSLSWEITHAGSIAKYYIQIDDDS